MNDDHTGFPSFAIQEDNLKARDWAESDRVPSRIGANKWDEVTHDDFGLYYDYELIEHGEDKTVVYPVSNAALQWCYRFLPEGIDRWDVNDEAKQSAGAGFILDNKDIPNVVAHMSRCRLFSDDDAAAEDNELARQWEDD